MAEKSDKTSTSAPSVGKEEEETTVSGEGDAGKAENIASVERNNSEPPTGGSEEGEKTEEVTSSVVAAAVPSGEPPSPNIDDVVQPEAVDSTDSSANADQPTTSNEIDNIPVNKVTRRPFSFRLSRGRRYEDNNPRPVSVQSASRTNARTSELGERRRDPISRFLCGLFSRDEHHVRDDVKPYEPEPEAWEPFTDGNGDDTNAPTGPSTRPPKGESIFLMQRHRSKNKNLVVVQKRST